MSDATPRRRWRGWKILGTVVGGIAACLLALYLWAGAVANRKFTQYDREIKAQVAAWRAKDASRPVLRGQAEPGNAADDYKLAFAEMGKIKGMGELGGLVEKSPKADPELGRKALALSGPLLDHLRRGAGRAGSRFPYEWEQGMGMNVGGLIDCQRAANVAVLAARSRAEEGKPREAAALLLDACQMGRDMAGDGVMISEMIGSAVLYLGLREIRDLLVDGKFDAEAIADLEAGLAVLDGSFPRHARSLENESMSIGVGMCTEADKSGWGVTRLLHTNAYEGASRCLHRAARAQDLPWAEAQREFTAAEGEAKSSWNPLVRIMAPSLAGQSKVGRERLAHLRLVRTALRFRASGEVPAFADPFGTTLKSSRDGDLLRVWSVGKDGVDDGGLGGWKADGKDIVVDVKR